MGVDDSAYSASLLLKRMPFCQGLQVRPRYQISSFHMQLPYIFRLNYCFSNGIPIAASKLVTKNNIEFLLNSKHFLQPKYLFIFIN